MATNIKEERHKYFKVKLLRSELMLEFNNLKDFNRFLILHRINTIFLLSGEQDTSAYFAVSYKGGLLRQSTEGFRSLEDFNEATRDKFPDAESFYAAHQMGYKTFAEYKLATDAGISSIEEYKTMKDKGFIEGFQEVTVNAPNPNFSNPYQFYKFALENQFETYAEYKTAISKGFDNGYKFRTASAKGFENAEDYETAMNAGFNNVKDLYFARENHIRDRADFMRFNDLQYMNSTNCKHDQRVLLILLSKLPDGKKVSINKLDELLTKAMLDYKYPDTQEMPKWFSTEFTGRQSVVDFLQKSEHVKKYGHYDTDGEYFETKLVKDRSVVIDGSNVAHNSAGNTDGKVLISNIIIMVKELQRRGFTDITVITDASLKHRVEDKENLIDLKEIATCLEAPAETSADIFIIQYVKHDHCLLVSNDVFREWKIIDPWIAQNIDYYRIAFMIKGDKVLLPDLDK